jgi:hypothetical protein
MDIIFRISTASSAHNLAIYVILRKTAPHVLTSTFSTIINVYPAPNIVLIVPIRLRAIVAYSFRPTALAAHQIVLSVTH